MLVRYVIVTVKAVPWHLWFGTAFWCTVGYLNLTNGTLPVGITAFCLAVLTPLPKAFSRRLTLSSFTMLLNNPLFLTMLIALLSGLA